MASRFNFYNTDASNDRNLLDELLTELDEVIGVTCYYIQATRSNVDKIFGESDKVEYNDAWEIELVLENPDGFDGGEQLYNKFGMNFTYTQSLSCGMKHFEDVTDLTQPAIGDLIYIPMKDKFYEINYVNNRTIFYQNGQKFVFRMDVQDFRFNGETIDTGIDEIDDNVPTTSDPYVENDNDIIDNIELEQDLIQDFDELEDITLDDLDVAYYMVTEDGDVLVTEDGDGFIII